MIKNSYKVLGVMSGTSLDGVDLAECYFDCVQDLENGSKQWSYRLGVTETVPYPREWQLRLKEAVYFSKGRLQTLDEEYTLLLGTTISQFIEKHDLKNLDAVCSHGHTILHQPDCGITLQIGNLSNISVVTQQTVVCDFRVKDVEMGGQGAPLVPIGDRLLFPEYDYCLNLGGFANCSFEQEGRRIAYDICAANIVLNDLAAKLGLPYDDKGQIAESGGFSLTLSAALRNLSYYKQCPPKSLGLEWVQGNIQPLLDASKIAVEDKLRTLTDHFGRQIGRQFTKGSSVLVTGGGAFNEYLLKRILFDKDVDLIIPSRELIEYKEALVFGLLGVLRLRGEVNCLSSVTGASEDVSAGVVYSPQEN